MRVWTDVCDVLGIEHPILMGALGGVGGAELVAAVSEAGGLGVIGIGREEPEWALAQMRRVRQLTGKPFGVNVVIRRPDHPFYPTFKRVVDFILQEQPRLVATGAGDPRPLIPVLKDKGIKVMPVTATVTHAMRAEQAGADLVVSSGMEGGGHVGLITTLALIPQVTAKVKIPVVAAGGVVDGRGMAACLALGAKAVQMGTRFAATVESDAHPDWKAAVLKATDESTVVVGRPFNDPCRLMRNAHTDGIADMEKKGTPQDEYWKYILGKSKAGFYRGDTDNGRIYFSQTAGLINDVPTCKEVIERMVAEAAATIKYMGALPR